MSCEEKQARRMRERRIHWLRWRRQISEPQLQQRPVESILAAERAQRDAGNCLGLAQRHGSSLPALQKATLLVMG